MLYMYAVPKALGQYNGVIFNGLVLGQTRNGRCYTG